MAMVGRGRPRKVPIEGATGDGIGLMSTAHPIGPKAHGDMLKASSIETAEIDIPIEDVMRSLQDRIDAQAVYSKAVSNSVVVLTNQLGDAGRTIDDLADRLAQLEMAVHGRKQDASIQQQSLERQTRFSAMQLAIQARGPGALPDEVIAAAEAFLVWLRTGAA